MAFSFTQWLLVLERRIFLGAVCAGGGCVALGLFSTNYLLSCWEFGIQRNWVGETEQGLGGYGEKCFGGSVLRTSWSRERGQAGTGHWHIGRAGTQKMTSGMMGTGESSANQILSANQPFFFFFFFCLVQTYSACFNRYDCWQLPESHLYWITTREKEWLIFQPALVWNSQQRAEQPFIVSFPHGSEGKYTAWASWVCQKGGWRDAGQI